MAKKYTLKVGLVFSIISINIIIVLCLGLVYNYHFTTISKQYEATLTEVAKEHRVILENGFSDLKSDIDYIATNPILELLQTNDTTLKKAIGKNFFNYIKAKDKYDQIRVLTKAGQEIVRVEAEGSSAVIIEDQFLQNKQDRYYVQESLYLKQDEIYISSLDLNKENGKVEVPRKPVIRFVKPVFDESFELQGFIIINYKAKNILDKIQGIVKENDIDFSLYNNDGDILLYQESYLNWAFMYKGRGITNIKQIHPSLWNKKEEFQGTIFNENNNIYYIKEYFPHKLLFNHMDTFGSKNRWYIILNKHLDNVSELAFKEMRDFIPISIAFALLSIVVGLKFLEYQRNLKKEEEKTRLAFITFRNTSQGIMISNEENFIVQINQAFTDITGYTKDEVLGKTSHFLRSSKTDESVYDEVNKELFATDIWEGTLWNKRKDGLEYPALCKINLFKNEKGKLKNYITVFSDISEHITIQENLEVKNRELVQAKDQVEHSMEDLKSAQSQLIQSEKMAALGHLVAGVAHEINTPLGAINSSASNILNALDKVLIKTLEVVSLLPEEMKKSFITIISCNLHTVNRVDLKKQRSIKRELSEKLKAQEIPNARRTADIIVSANLADMMETPFPLLQSNYAEDILDAISSINSIILNTKNISVAVSKSSRIVKALKNYSHQSNDNKMVLEKISEGIETVLDVYHNQMKREIVLTTEYGEFSAIMCHFDELNQVWTNIIQNAIHAMNHKGEMKISISEDEKYQIVQISDNGMGISKAVQENMFEPFYTTKPRGEGTGLGLDIVKKIIAKHNGKIEVHSEIGVGTTFSVFIDKNLQD